MNRNISPLHGALVTLSLLTKSLAAAAAKPLFTEKTIPYCSTPLNGKGKKTAALEKSALICEHYQVSADYLLGFRDED